MSKIERLWEQVRALFDIERGIKDVDTWDGSADRWDTAEAYCDDCLIDVNAPAGREEKAKSHCMLPIREPGDSADTFVRQAVYAAVAGHGIGQVKRPDDVPADAWELAVKGAANKIITAYGQMSETAPAAIYHAAGREPPEGAERGIMVQNLYDRIWVAVTKENPLAWVNDLYIEDDGSLSAILTVEGKVLKVGVEQRDGEITLGDWIPVDVQYVPRQRKAGLTIVRQANGLHRWVALAETAALLRVGEIDSRELFDDFVHNAVEHGYPALRFYHDDRLALGVADWLARDENCLLASGTLDDGDLAQALVASCNRGDRWGISVGFNPTELPELWEVAEGVTIPVNQRGILCEISVLPEDRAASWFTAIGTMEVTRMRAEVADALRTLFGDEERAEAFIDLVDGTNREISDRGMVTRGADNAEQGEADKNEETAEYILTDEMVSTIAGRVRESLPPPPDVAAITQQIQALDATMSALRSRLDALERTEDDKQREWLADLPARRTVNVTYRPREEHKADKAERTFADIADNTLSVLK